MLKRVSFLLLNAGIALSSQAFSAEDEPPWVIEGSIYNVLDAGDETLFYAGFLQRAGPVTGPLVAVTGGEIATTFPNVIGRVNVVRSDLRGGFYVGGSFVVDVEGDAEIVNLVNVLPSGGIDLGWTPNPDGPVTTIDVNDAGVFVGGSFLTIAGEPRNSVAKFSPAGELEPWRIDVDYPIGVSKIVSDDQRIYMAGAFQRLGDVEDSHGLLGVDKHDSSRLWRSLLRGGPNITDLEIRDGRLYFAGRFEWLKEGVTRRGFAVMDIETREILDVNPTFGDRAEIRAVELHGDRIYVAGRFSSVGSVNRSGLVELSLDGEVTDWVPPVVSGHDRSDGSVSGLRVVGDELYVLGDFDGYSSWLGGLSAYDTATGRPVRAPYIDGTVNSVAFTGEGAAIVGGDFETVADSRAPYLALVDGEGSVSSFASGLDGPVRKVWNAGGRTWLAGEFNGAERFWCPAFLALKADGTLEEVCPSNDGVVEGVVEFAGHTVVTGSFTEFLGERVDGIVVLDDRLGISDLTPSLAPAGRRATVESAVVHDAKLYLLVRLYGDSASSVALMTLDESGTLEQVGSPRASGQLINHGHVIASIGARQIVELDTRTGKETRYAVPNESIYITPRNATAWVNRHYLIGSSRAIGGTGQFGAIVGAAGDDGNSDAGAGSVPGSAVAMNSAINDLTVHKDTLWVASEPMRSKERGAASVLRIDLRSNAVTGALGIGPTSPVVSVEKIGDTVIYAGDAISHAAEPVGPVVKADHEGVVDLSWRLNDPYLGVLNAAVLGDGLYICARMDRGYVLASIGLDDGSTRWAKPVAVDGGQCLVEAHNGYIYLARIVQVGGVASHMAKLDTDGNVLETGIADARVSSMNRSNGKLFVTGEFMTFRGLERPGVAAIDESGEVTPWQTDLIGDLHLTVTAVLELEDRYLILGSFQPEIDGRRIRHALAVDADGARLDWRLSADLSSSIVSAVRAGEHVIVTGYFNRILRSADPERADEYRPLYGIAAFDRSGTILDWNPGAYAGELAPRDAVIVNGRLYLGWSGMGAYPRTDPSAPGPPRRFMTLAPTQIPFEVE